MTHSFISKWRSHELLALVLVAGFLTSIQAILAQAPLASDPVGIRSNSCLSNSDTFVSVPFTRIPEFIGLIQSISGNVITVVGTPGWAANQFVYAAGSQPKRYYLLIGPSSTIDPKEGHIYPVTANGSNTLTLDTTLDNLVNVPANSQILLIPYWTLATVFPASDRDVSFTATILTAAYKTQIRIPDSSVSGIDFPYSPVYFYSNNVDGTLANVGWRIVGDNTTDHGDDPLPLGSYFVVRNANSAPTLAFTTLGAVLTKKVTVGLKTAIGVPQDNPVSILQSLNVALEATGLGPADGSFIANDQLLLFDNAQVAFDKAPSATYYYDTTFGNSGGWRLTGDASIDRGGDLIAGGTGFVLRKAATGDGQTAFWTNSFHISAVSAVSRKTHGSAGTFDLDLPLTGDPGIECRKGQGPNSDEHQLVITFPTAVSIGSAAVTAGAGSVSGTNGSGTPAITVNLTGITNAQRLTVTLLAVSDGTNVDDVAVRMNVVAADTTSNGFVNSADINQVKSQSGHVVTTSNFREDVIVDGAVNSADISFTKSKSGTALP